MTRSEQIEKLIKDAKEIFDDLLKDFEATHIDKMGMWECGSRTLEWIKDYRSLPSQPAEKK
jgi:hypothetical protein